MQQNRAAKKQKKKDWPTAIILAPCEIKTQY